MDEDRIDRLLQEWGRNRRASAPGVHLPSRLPARRRWVVPAAAAAAAVIGVAVVLSVAQSGGQRAAQAPLTSASSGQPSDTTTPSPATQQITVRGLAITVPAAWPLNDQWCGVPQHDTVIVDTGALSCFPGNWPRVTAVEFASGSFVNRVRKIFGLVDVHTAHGPVDRHRADEVRGRIPKLSNEGGRPGGLYLLAVGVPDIDTSVVITSPSKTLAEQLAETLRVVSKDSNGCPVRSSASLSLETGRPPARAGAENTLIPDHPSSIVVCRYVAGVLGQSTTVPTGQQAWFQARVNRLPNGLSRDLPGLPNPLNCRAASEPLGTSNGYDDGDGEGYVIHVGYPSGPPLILIARLGDCGRLGISNGTQTGQRTNNLLNLLIEIAGNTEGWRQHVRPTG